MHVTATLSDERLETIAIRVHDPAGQPAQTAVRAAARALSGASPAPRRMSDMPPGTVVEVPPLAQGAHRPGAKRTKDAVASGLVGDHVVAAAALLGPRLFEDASAETSEAEAALTLARSPELAT
jgi:hypothetical protein